MVNESGETTTSKYSLKWWGILVAIIVGVCSTLYTAIQIYSYFTQISGPKIVEDVDENRFQYPPQLWDEMKDKFQAAAKNDLESRSVASDISLKFNPLTDYVVVTIRNSGDLLAENVRILLSGNLTPGGIATIKREGHPDENLEYSTEIAIGQLDVNEQVAVHIWSGYQVPDEITIAHNAGSKRVTVREWGASIWRPLLWMIVIIGGFWLLIAIGHLYERYIYMKRKLEELTSQD